VSTSLVHYHFETREALLEQALEYSFELAGDVRIGEQEGDAPDHTRRLAAMVDQCLPYPGQLERDWILWVELWLRAVRHPELRPTAARLYARMHRWFAEAIAAGARDGEFDRGADPAQVADRVLAVCDGFGVRALLGEMSIERARAEVWAVLSSELGVDPAVPRG
jgi:AcrR family transcriptional regulator